MELLRHHLTFLYKIIEKRMERIFVMAFYLTMNLL